MNHIIITKFIKFNIKKPLTYWEWCIKSKILYGLDLKKGNGEKSNVCFLLKMWKHSVSVVLLLLSLSVPLQTHKQKQTCSLSYSHSFKNTELKVGLRLVCSVTDYAATAVIPERHNIGCVIYAVVTIAYLISVTYSLYKHIFAISRLSPCQYVWEPWISCGLAG